MNAGESTTKSFPGTGPPAAKPASAVTQAAAQTLVAPTRSGPARLRWALIGAMAGLALLVAVRLGMVDGLVLRRVTIDGPSMAPAFLGAHYGVTCGDCGFLFACDATDVPASGRVVCPNCGFRDNELQAENLLPGEPVLIDRWRGVWESPQRGAIVAARHAEQPDELIIKRIAALPGEQLEIRGGDLYVGGQIVRKSLREIRSSRVLVHDNDFQPHKSSGLPARWQAAAGSRWKAENSNFRYLADEGAGQAAAVDWLDYHHWACTQSPAPRTRLVPILDNDAFNQNQSRQLNAVSDVLLTCQVQIEGQGQLTLAAIDGSDRFDVVLDTIRRHVALLRNGEPMQQKPVAADLLRGRIGIEFGLCDQQILLSIAGRPLLQHAYQPASGPRPDVLHPLAIGASRVEVDVHNLEVWRDSYYLEPLGTARPWRAEQPLAPDQFALLGDNPPVSIDARQAGGTLRSAILGPVYRPFWSTGR